MNRYILSGLLLMTSLLSTQQLFADKMGGSAPGGGGMCVLRLRSLREALVDISESIKTLKVADVDTREFVHTLKTAQFDTGEKLVTTKYKPEGTSVDFLNYPDKGLIVADKNTCQSSLKDPRAALTILVHEVLGLMQIEDSENQISKNVLIELNRSSVENNGRDVFTELRITSMQNDSNAISAIISNLKNHMYKKGQLINDIEKLSVSDRIEVLNQLYEILQAKQEALSKVKPNGGMYTFDKNLLELRDFTLTVGGIGVSITGFLHMMTLPALNNFVLRKPTLRPVHLVYLLFGSMLGVSGVSEVLHLGTSPFVSIDAAEMETIQNEITSLKATIVTYIKNLKSLETNTQLKQQ